MCDKNHEWLASIHNITRTKRSGCPEYAGRKKR
ncbi:hypothetical protein FIM04_01590 [SAR202 cluster bacterium AC-409-J13_OGT_754m]|nr:hypothetical protein [SAR202 cluster bacterium AC-409-J13_OGT_754m]